MSSSLPSSERAEQNNKIMRFALSLLLSPFALLRDDMFLHAYSIPEGGTGDRIS